jgi:hypothetical protein
MDTLAELFFRFFAMPAPEFICAPCAFVAPAACLRFGKLIEVCWKLVRVLALA